MKPHPNYVAFAQQLVHYSTKVQPGDQVIVQAYDMVPKPMVIAIIDAVREAGGNVADVWLDSWDIEAALLKKVDKQQLRILGMGRLAQICAANVCIILRGFDNMYSRKGVPAECLRQWGAGIEKQIMDERVNFGRWTLTRWPTPTMATMAGVPTDEFEQTFFDAVLFDYARMSAAMDPLVALMEQTKVVRIKGPGETEVTFSIEGMKVVKCDGHRNIPDGEVYTAPVIDSMNGVIHYNTPTVNKAGHEFSGIRLYVEGGVIVKASCESGDNARLQEYLDTDKGARRFGEFAVGVNPMILQPMKESLFDE